MADTPTVDIKLDSRKLAEGIRNGARVKSEPLTYERSNMRRSYFQDLVLRERDPAARERLERHRREMDIELRKRAEDLERRSRDATLPGGPLAGVEYRVEPNTSTGTGGEFAPPLWLVQYFATAPRPKRALAQLIAQAGAAFPLPQGVSSVNLPRVTSGVTDGTTVPNAGVPDSDIQDAQVTAPAVTISGQQDAALQNLEQSPQGAHFDWAMFKELTEAYDATLETQLINGSGTGQITGIINQTLSGAPTTGNQVTTTQTSATGMFGAIGQVIAMVGLHRQAPPETWLMTTSRMAWLGSSEDTQNRPLMIADKDGTGTFDLLTIEVNLDDAIPRTLGAGANQDCLIACRPSDLILMESDLYRQISYEPLSGELGVRFTIRGYAAAFTGRYPSSIATLTGTGMAIPTGF